MGLRVRRRGIPARTLPYHYVGLSALSYLQVAFRLRPFPISTDSLCPPKPRYCDCLGRIFAFRVRPGARIDKVHP